MNQNHSINVAVSAVVPTGTDDQSTQPDKNMFNVVVSYGPQSWEVKHSREEFKTLSEALFLEVADETFPKLSDDVTTSEASSFQEYLLSVIENLKENLWYKEVIMAFLDEEPNKSYLTQVQLSKMSKQISYLLSKTAENEQKFLDIEAKSAKLDKIVEYLTSNMNNKPTPSAPEPQQQRLPLPPKSVDPSFQTHAAAAAFFNLPSSIISASPANSQRKGSSPPAMSDDPLFQELGGALEDNGLDTVGKSAFGNEEDFDISLLDNSRGAPNNLLLDDDLLRLSGDYHQKWDQTLKSHGADGSSGAAAKALGHTTGPSSKYVPRESMSSIEEPLHYDKTIDEILDALQPHESQIQYRQSAVGLLKKQSRLALNSTTYEVGLHALHCFLPTDTIKLSVVISKNQVPYWHTSLGERLKLMEGGVVPVDDAQYPDIYDDYKPMMNHAVRAVSFLNEKDVFKVVCAVDSLEVEISANARTDICMLAFLEEVSEMVGLDNLFKRSLLLIRAWWVYETASYVGCPIKHYLSDFSLCIMVCAIFNQFHAQIGSPLQALCLFLSEYSGYDGTTHAITLHGIIPFKTPSTAQAAPGNARADHLINTQFIDKYRKLFNLQSAADAEATAAEDPKGAKHQQPYYSIVNKNILNFTRFGFNVVHPFTSANMITEKLSARRLQLIAKAFQIGAMNLSVVLKQSNDNMKSARDLINSYFPAVLSKFSNNYRPDAIGNSIILASGLESSNQFTNSRDIMNISIDKIWQNILYCNFIIESIVSESAILTFFLDNLALKGPLPVGEIGKMLSEVSSIPNLSQKLKDKFGGLKKFLERFQDLFVFSNDHPFNPHVILRNTLTAQQLETIENGGSFPIPTAPGSQQTPGIAPSPSSIIAPAAGKSKPIGSTSTPVVSAVGSNKPKGSGLLMGPGVSDYEDGDLSLSGGAFDSLGGGGGGDSMSLFNNAMNAASIGAPGGNKAPKPPGAVGSIGSVGGGVSAAPGPAQKFPAAPGLSAAPGNFPAGADKKQQPSLKVPQGQPGQQFNVEDSPVLRGLTQPPKSSTGFNVTAPAFNPGASAFAPSGAIGKSKQQQLGSSALNNDFLLDNDYEYSPLVAPQTQQQRGGPSSMLSQLRENTTELSMGGGGGGMMSGPGKQQQMGMQQGGGQPQQPFGGKGGMYDPSMGGGSRGGYDPQSQQYHSQQQQMYDDHYGGGGGPGMKPMSQMQGRQMAPPLPQQGGQQGQRGAGGPPPMTQQQMYHQQQQMQMQQQGGGQQPQYNSFKTYR